MGVKSFQDLVVWQKAMDLAEAVHNLSKAFPSDERFGLTAQLRRSAVSIPSNIAEGQGRQTTADFLKFLSIAYGSLCEVETQILLAERFGYIDATASAELRDQTAEVGRLLNGLRRSLRTTSDR